MKTIRDLAIGLGMTMLSTTVACAAVINEAAAKDVPEPADLALFAGGVALLAWRQHRGGKRAA